MRAVDAPSVVNVEARLDLKRKVEGMMAGYVSGVGCADGSLYRRMTQAGLRGVNPLLQLAIFDDLVQEGFLRQIVEGWLRPEDAGPWRVAEARARADRTFFIARPFHCAVGVKV